MDPNFRGPSSKHVATFLPSPELEVLDLPHPLRRMQPKMVRFCHLQHVVMGSPWIYTLFTQEFQCQMSWWEALGSIPPPLAGIPVANEGLVTGVPVTKIGIVCGGDWNPGARGVDQRNPVVLQPNADLHVVVLFPCFPMVFQTKNTHFSPFVVCQLLGGSSQHF